MSAENLTLAGAVIITGLLVVFVALIGLWGIVALFGKLLSSRTQKPKAPEAPKAPAPAAPAQAAAPAPVKPAMAVEDGISDEIVAVIAAAVTAMGGGAFALRSVRRAREARPVWAQAGLLQNTQPF